MPLLWEPTLETTFMERIYLFSRELREFPRAHEQAAAALAARLGL